MKGRKVDFYAVYADDSKDRFDSDRASKEGYAGGFGKVKEGFDSVIFKAKEITAGGVKCKKEKLIHE